MSSRRKRKSILDVSSRHIRRLISRNNQPKNIIITNQLPQEIQESEHNLGTDNSNLDLDTNMNDYTEDYPEDCATECCTSNNNLPHHEPQNQNDLNVYNTPNYFNDLTNQGEKHEENRPSLIADLGGWATKYKTKRRAVSGLLTVLRKHETNADLPKDYRSLIKTPRTTKIQSVEPGNYYHFDIKSQIVEILNFEYKTFKFKEIQLKIGIDGLPMSNSSSSQLWPILGCIHPSSRIFLIGVYHGYSKPKDSNQFLERVTL